ncbi:MAG: pyruvate dehydrogenase (acetyl-transferring), homodimeric type [Gammaproteobacteria bacterium]
MNDIDPQETREWLDSLHAILENDGEDRAHFIIEQLITDARLAGVNLPFRNTTAYVNTIPADEEERLPGNPQMEHRVRSLERWNALATVIRANKKFPELGGHISTYASSATLMSIGFNHFFRPAKEGFAGDCVYFQGHAAPGVYARAFLEGRLSEEQLLNYRREVEGKGLSSYPHPWLMKDFWQFPTVSMGLAGIMGIYQARFMEYLHDRGIIDKSNRKVWVFTGDGEMDEPESLGAISLAAREELDNLIFVINCNLQRLDGPVRGNGKIIQELEGVFRGAGWNVIKVVWGENWDPLLAKDKDGFLRKRMEEALDGDYQNYRAKGGAYVREHFFGKYPELDKIIENMTDDDIWRLNRGGHDQQKVYAAYAAAMKHTGQPTVILAKTVKGYGLGKSGESMNIAHQLKKPTKDSLQAFRDRYRIPISDEELEEVPFYKPPADSPEMLYIKQLREKLQGELPKRNQSEINLEIPSIEVFNDIISGSDGRENSTTMAFVRILIALTRDKAIAKYVVPIVPDEARTFGMEGLFRSLGIYAHKGQLYDPVDADQVMYYREDQAGQILEEGINEAGAMSSWIAAATSYSNHDVPMIPFYIYYSMFGFQRIGDLAWAAGDSRARGFLIGGTAGRTTLAGEGLQHQDGHSHLLASTIPNCRAYDPTYAYELAVIVHHGMQTMFVKKEDYYYYITVMNENYAQPPMPEGCEEGIISGMYCLQPFQEKPDSTAHPNIQHVQLMGSGAILREVIAAADILNNDYSITSDIWSVTSFNRLRRNGMEVQRWNMLHPNAEHKKSYVEKCLDDKKGPVIAASDYMKIYADQIRPYIKSNYVVLGTDGFGRSDTRKQLRHHFEVNAHYIVIAAIYSLIEEGALGKEILKNAMQKYGIDPNKADPVVS